MKGDLCVLGIESTAHTFSASVVTEKEGLLSDVRDVYVPPEGSGIHPTEAAKHHTPAVAAKVIKEALSLGWRGGRGHRRASPTPWAPASARASGWAPSRRGRWRCPWAGRSYR